MCKNLSIPTIAHKETLGNQLLQTPPKEPIESEFLLRTLPQCIKSKRLSYDTVARNNGYNEYRGMFWLQGWNRLDWILHCRNYILSWYWDWSLNLTDLQNLLLTSLYVCLSHKLSDNTSKTLTVVSVTSTGAAHDSSYKSQDRKSVV